MCLKRLKFKFLAAKNEENPSMLSKLQNPLNNRYQEIQIQKNHFILLFCFQIKANYMTDKLACKTIRTRNHIPLTIPNFISFHFFYREKSHGNKWNLNIYSLRMATLNAIPFNTRNICLTLY